MRCGERGKTIEAKHGMWQMRQGNRGKVWDVAIEARHGKKDEAWDKTKGKIGKAIETRHGIWHGN